ncbi:MAG: type 1 glutamine amidotransferase, partial [Anaerolineales bacterium]
ARRVLGMSHVTQADELYMRMLAPMAPNATLDTLYVADLDVGLPAGAAINSYDGYLWTGSNLTIYDDVPEVTRQIELCRAIYAAGVPQYGSCWGVQMAAVAAGGQVQKNPRGREWSIARDIRLTEAGRVHPMYAGKPEKFDAFIMHLDMVTRIPEGGALLASNAHSPVQALTVEYRGGVFWATQYHPEYTLYEMARLLIARKAPLVKEGFFEAEAGVERLVENMTMLSENPGDVELRAEIAVGDDILSDSIRQCEVRNWLARLVVPAKRAAEAAPA